MRDLVLVPTFARPEYLALCLEHIWEAGGRNVWIAQDNHFSDCYDTKQRNREAELIAESFRNKFDDLRFTNRQPHGYVGNPYNFLELYKSAYTEPDIRFVYLIEDDVLVAKDFFRWHEAVQSQGDYLCSVAWHCIRNDNAVKSDDPESYIESAVDFSSIGVCWKRENLSVVVAHAKEEYYRDLIGYMRRTFPTSEIHAEQWTEQAGLITRILLQSRKHKVAWAAKPRCAHIGINGYHRQTGYKFRGPIQHRIENLRKASSDTTQLAHLSRDTFDDVSALPPSQEWSELKLVQSIHG